MENDNIYFSGLKSDENEVFFGSKNNQNFVKNQKAFVELLKNALSPTDKQQRNENIDKLVSNKEFVYSLNSNQLMNIFTECRNLGNFNSMIKLYDNSQNKSFKDMTMVKELFMVACNKTSLYDRTIKMANEMIANRQTSGDVYGALGKAYKLKKDQVSTPEEKREFLEKSALAYEKGFEEFAEFYPGINAVYSQINIGNLDKAKSLAKLVYLACMKEGAEETKDYWCTTTKLESACIINENEEEIYKSLNDVLRYDVPDWQFQTTVDTLSSIKNMYPSKTINSVIEKLQERINEDTKQESVKKEIDQNDKAQAIIKNSYGYRGLASNFEGASSVGGNIKFGGQLPDHTVSRKDIELFDSILDTPLSLLFPNNDFPKNLDPNKTINQIENTDEFLTTVDTFIRYHFGMENFAGTGLHLEDNAGIQNSKYDQAVEGLLALGNVLGDRGADSRTNISAIFALGIGDCRHHAQVKQILFDRWQGLKMTNALKEAYAGLNNGNQVETDKAVARFNQIYHEEQLRTVDVSVFVPIKLKAKYEPIIGKDGKMIESQFETPIDSQTKETPLEEHTMTLMIKRDNKGNLSSLRITDAFYQEKLYHWANKTINLDEIKIDKHGNYIINAETFDGKKTDSGKELPVTIIPTAYAGKRDQKCKDDHGGNVRLLGMPIHMNTKEDFIQRLQKRQKCGEILMNISNWNIKTKAQSNKKYTSQNVD